MRHPVARIQPTRHCLLPIVAVIALLAMPVQYRGGAALPHPHALFQLWTPGGHGLIHHDPDAAGPTASNASEPANGGLSAVIGAAERDHPALTAMTVLGEQAVAIGVVVLAVLLLLFDRLAFPGDVSRRLVGFTLAPIHPPPR